MNFRAFFILLTACFAFLLPLNADPIHTDQELDAVIVQANGLFLDSKFDEGIELIRQIGKSRPNNPAVSFFIANGYWWKIFRGYIYDKDAKDTEFETNFDNYLKETITRSEDILERNKKDPQALFYLGNAYSLRSRVKGLHGSYFSAGRDAAKGKYYLEEVLKISPKQYDTFYNLGVYHYFASTLPGFAKVLKALLFLPGGSREKGLSLLEEAGQKSIYFADESQLILARFYADFEEEPYEALRIVETYHKKHPDNAWFHYWMATLYSDEINDYYQGADIYKEILEKYNQSVMNYTEEVRNQAWLKLARCYSRQLDPDRGIAEIQKLIAGKPKAPSWILPRTYLELGNIYDTIGMRKEALDAYRQVLSYPDYRDYHNQAEKLLHLDYNQTPALIFRANLEGRRLCAAGRFAEAEIAFQKVMEQYPNNEQTLLAMAEMNYAKGSYKEAADLLNQILGRRPEEPRWLLASVYVRLGQVSEARKQVAAARSLYEKALDTKFLASDDRNIAKRALKQMSQKSS